MSVIYDRKEVIKTMKQQFIVDVTTDLFREIGIEETSMDDIALKANYTKRTLYAYFQSKDEIFLWAFNDEQVKRWKYQKEQIDLASTGLEKLKMWALSLYEYCNKNPASMQLQNYMDYHLVKMDKVDQAIFQRFEDFNNEMADVLRAAFKLGQEDGSIREGIQADLTISHFAYAFRAILTRAFSSAYSFTEIDKSEYINQYLDLSMRSLQKTS